MFRVCVFGVKDWRVRRMCAVGGLGLESVNISDKANRIWFLKNKLIT